MEKAGAELNLSFLLEEERDVILKVLQKDEKLRKREEKRIRKLKNELVEIKRKGSRRPQEVGERQCSRCLKSLGLIFDRGDLCDECQQRVCNGCRVSSPKGRQWKCSVCAKIMELKVSTGEWFMEERSRRFEIGTALSSDTVKHSIMSSPAAPPAREESPKSDRSSTPVSNIATAGSTTAGTKRKGLRIGRKAARPGQKPGGGADSRSVCSASAASDTDTHSVCSARSLPRSALRTHRGSAVALEPSGLPTVPNNLRSSSQTADRDRSPTPSNLRSSSQTADRDRSPTPSNLRSSSQTADRDHSPTPSNLRPSSQTTDRDHSPTPSNLRPSSKTADRNRSPTPSNSSRRVRPDGAESVASFRSTDGVSDKMADPRSTESGTPSIAVSRPSVSSDRSRSEEDLSLPPSELHDDAFSLRSRSVPGLNDTEFSDEERDEDIDALMSAHGVGAGRRLSSAMSTSSTPGSERRWGHLGVPDSDAETSSLNSMMSLYSETGDYGNVRVSGEMLLNISYSYKTGALNVTVKECRNLATGDERKQRTDAYVKAYLLPDKSRLSKRKTSIKTNTINPIFNENLRYVISHSQLETRTLQLSVWHNDRFGHNRFLGEVEITFDSWEFDTLLEEWYTLQPKVDSGMDNLLQYKGELTVVLKYIPAERNLTLPLDQVQVKKGFLKGKKTSIKLPKGGMVELLVKEAKNLTAVKSGGTSDPFVKGYLLPDNSKSTKHKTAVERRTTNPQWNHTFTYCGLQAGDLNNVCLELTVWDKEAVASNVFLGGVRLGAGTGHSYGNEVDWMDSYGEEQRLWQRMIDNPEVPQECTLMLRSSMGKRQT